jgi:hypothetical protein
MNGNYIEVANTLSEISKEILKTTGGSISITEVPEHLEVVKLQLLCDIAETLNEMLKEKGKLNA